MSDVERDRYDLDEERPIDEEAETLPLAEPPIEVPEADSLDQQREVPLDEDDDRA